MASFSQGFLELLVGKEIANYTAETLALVDGGAGADTIIDSGNQFVSEGFEAGAELQVLDATDSDDEISTQLVTVVAGTLTLPTGIFTTGEAAGASITLKAFKSYSLKRLLFNGWLDLFSGSPPTSADYAETGTLLASISGWKKWKDVAWNATTKVAKIESAITYGDSSADATGVATWGRYYCLAHTTGASTNAARFDVSVSTSSGTGEVKLATTSLTAGQAVDITSFYVEVPQ